MQLDSLDASIIKHHVDTSHPKASKMAEVAAAAHESKCRVHEISSMTEDQ